MYNLNIVPLFDLISQDIDRWQNQRIFFTSTAFFESAIHVDIYKYFIK